MLALMSELFVPENTRRIRFFFSDICQNKTTQRDEANSFSFASSSSLRIGFQGKWIATNSIRRRHMISIFVK